MRSTCWPATAARRSASCATTSTPSSTLLARRWRRPSSAPRSPCWATRPRAERALQAALQGASADKDDGDTRRDYGTGMRDGAALITLASETGIAKPEVPRLVDVVAKAYAPKTYTSTQEQAWMLLAARALADEAKNTTLTVNGAGAPGPAHPRAHGRRS